MFNLSGFWGGVRSSADRTVDSLDAFSSERPSPPSADNPLERRNRLRQLLREWPRHWHLEWPLEWRRQWPLDRIHPVAAILLALVVAAGILVKVWISTRPAPAFAVVTIESDPAGAHVSMQGIPQGVTPLALSIPAGEHGFEVEYRGRRTMLRGVATPDTSVVHHVQFDKSELAPPVPTTGRAARSAPAGAPTAGPVGGWLTVSAPIPLQILENNQVVGTSAARRVMLPAGTRKLRFVNEALGFSAERTVKLGAGRTAEVTLTVPRAPLSINAVPWAEVWVDGVRIGETPIGNHMVAIGSHEVVFRHPQYGERRQSATVSLKSPARVSVDLRNPR